MNSRLLAVLAAALLAAIAVIVPVGADDDDDGAHEQRPETLLQVELAPAVQKRAGIETVDLQAVNRRPEIQVVAEVLALGPLFEQRAAVVQARAAAKIAEAQLTAARDTYERLRTLHGENANVSGRELARARAEWQSRQAERDAAVAKQQDRRAGFAHAWSEPLAAAAMAGDSELFAALRQGRTALAVLTLPAGRSLDPATDEIFVARDEQRDAARRARVLAPAAATQGTGETWLLRMQAQGLRSGMRLTAWVPVGGARQNQVRIPADAVIWQGGLAWVYLQTAADTFVRRPLPDRVRSGDAWLVGEGFSPGARLVTVGAQLLLGQELRARIPEEDDD